MKRCSVCLMPESKPGIRFDETGLCSACIHKEMKKNTNYKKRKSKLMGLCDSLRKTDGGYDCIIAVSGGKDSTFQTHIMKEVYHMNPLLLCVTDDFTHTKAGTHNLNNLSDRFNCDIMILHVASDFNRRMSRWGFENIGSTNWAIDRAIYAWPLKVAANMGIKLVVYGEDVGWEYGGVLEEETPSAKNQIMNDVVKPLDDDKLVAAGFSLKEMNMMKYPTLEEVETLEPIYLSYFYPWDWDSIISEATRNGFKSLCGEWKRKGYVDDKIQLDSVGYLFNYYIKFLKLGFSQPTHVVSHMIRWGHMTKKEGAELINANEGILDPLIKKDFMRFVGYTETQLNKICDKWANKKYLTKVKGQWRLKKEHCA